MSKPSSQVVQTEELFRQLDHRNLRVYDCTVRLAPTADDPFRTESGRGAWLEGRIPGAGFLDLEGALSQPPQGKLRYMLPSPQRFAEVVGRAGIGDGADVVLYSAGHPMWAARVWWMLRLHGFDQVRLLDGGWEKWVREGMPVESGEPTAYLPAQFELRLRPQWLATRQDVLDAAGAGRVLVNALTRKQHAGQGVHYGRPGRIPGSVCVPALEVTDRGSGMFLPEARLRELMGAVLQPGAPVITYCGAGIAAACDAFVLDFWAPQVWRCTTVRLPTGPMIQNCPWKPADRALLKLCWCRLA